MRTQTKQPDEQCPICKTTGPMHTHHVLGRVGKEKDEPHNLIRICYKCHDRWHGPKRDSDMAERIYKIMKQRHGNKFPMIVNGKPYKTKWVMVIENKIEREEAEHGTDAGTGT